MLYKLDLHIHTPASSCYCDNVATRPVPATRPADIIDGAVARGLAAIAITDHNTVKGLEFLEEAIHASDLCIFPGIEIGAREGHVLALWDPGTPLDRLKNVLRDTGFNADSDGQGYWQTELGMDQVFRAVRAAGGLVVAAHVDRRPKGFVASPELSLQEKKSIYASPDLQALEITIVEDKNDWNRGKAPYLPGMACIQGSDAHAVEEIGRRPVYMDIPDLTLASLDLAFKEFSNRIFFPGEIKDAGTACRAPTK